MTSYFTEVINISTEIVDATDTWVGLIVLGVVLSVVAALGTALGLLFKKMFNKI